MKSSKRRAIDARPAPNESKQKEDAKKTEQDHEELWEKAEKDPKKVKKKRKTINRKWDQTQIECPCREAISHPRCIVYILYCIMYMEHQGLTYRLQIILLYRCNTQKWVYQEHPQVPISVAP